MASDRPLFILAGNGPYDNRGCEAIVRGTVKILRKYFENPHFVCISHFQSDQQFEDQKRRESDSEIIHFSTRRLNKRKVIKSAWKLETWYDVFHYAINKDTFFRSVYRDMVPFLSKAEAVLSIGGDNYSLDYGIPSLFTALDDLVISHKKPIILWGASVGPFSSKPDYEKYMSDHLRKVTGIYARESETIRYLESIGVTENVYPVADPAFLMDPKPPQNEINIENDAIGINLSPLMGRYVTSGDSEKWIAMAGDIIAEVSKRTGRHIYLMPHVTSPHSDDYAFMQKVISRLREINHNITLIPPHYDAAEKKWIISRMAFFTGARTHSTIAALSSGVPTLSLAYSIKARGINRDIFGHTEYCMESRDIEPDSIVSKIISMLDQETSIRTELRERIPKIQKSALDAGLILEQLIKEN